MTTTNYYNTFIEIAEDCLLLEARIPVEKGGKKTIASIQFDIIKDNPYKYTSDEILFDIHVDRNNVGDVEAERIAYFSKGQACLRCSPLAKSYGWGIHFDDEGRIAIYPVESDEYKKLKDDNSLKHLRAMRSSRK